MSIGCLQLCGQFTTLRVEFMVPWFSLIDYEALQFLYRSRFSQCALLVICSWSIAGYLRILFSLKARSSEYDKCNCG
jgi:hypothetical protein